MSSSSTTARPFEIVQVPPHTRRAPRDRAPALRSHQRGRLDLARIRELVRFRPRDSPRHPRRRGWRHDNAHAVFGGEANPLGIDGSDALSSRRIRPGAVTTNIGLISSGALRYRSCAGSGSHDACSADASTRAVTRSDGGPQTRRRSSRHMTRPQSRPFDAARSSARSTCEM